VVAAAKGVLDEPRRVDDVRPEPLAPRGGLVDQVVDREAGRAVR
jgi:hypothetical protein